MPVPENYLLNLPAAGLALLRGDRRARLLNYLDRWDHPDALLRYVDDWLAEQPERVTLRESRARALVALGRADDALAVLDALDAERERTPARWAVRLRALAAAGRTDDLLALAPRPDDVDATHFFAWLRYGDVCRAVGRYDEAAEAYGSLSAIAPDAAPLHRLAELALETGDAATARGHLETIFVRNAERRPTVDELRLLHAACAALEDTEAVAALSTQLAQREHEERAAIEKELGLHLDDTALAATPVAAPAARGTQQAALPDAAYAMLRDHFGLHDFRPNQAQIIGNVLAGRSTLAIMPTGAGKSLTYQLPAMLLPRATVVISPLIALMKDQIDGLPAAVRGRAVAINSSMPAGEVRERLRGIAAGRYKLVYVAPERLRQRPFLDALQQAGISLFVVDEAHCVSMWGLSFRPDYLFIRAALDALGGPPLLALTATASAETQAEIQERLGPLVTVMASVFRPNLRFEVQRAGNRQAKIAAVVALCTSIAGPVIVYARARDACEELAGHLRRAGVRAAHYHAQVPERAAVQERFMTGETRVLVATVAFGMGVDKADVRGIIHYNLPQSVEAYYQEAGRAGRDGQPARCILLYAANDKGQMTSWLRQDAISKGDLRGLFRTLRQMIPGRYGIVGMDALQRAVGREEDTFVRVGVSMLERVGLLRRHFDVPRSATIAFLKDDDPEIERLARAARLRRGQAADCSLLDLATALDCDPSDLEADLLRWANAGAVSYTGVARDPLIELLPAPADVSARIDALLADYQTRQDQRIAAMAAYAKGAVCRHRALAAHFGQRLARCGTLCDICAPGERQRAAPAARRVIPANPSDDRPDTLRVLCGIAMLPYPMGRRNIARALTGAESSPLPAERYREFGVMQHLTVTRVEEIIERLIAEGYVRRVAVGEFPVLALARRGQEAIDDPALLPAWAQPQAGGADEPEPDAGIVDRLRAWRTEKARAAGLPAYIILSNATLEGLARQRPQSLAALRCVKGIGEKTATAYGAELLQLLA